MDISGKRSGIYRIFCRKRRIKSRKKIRKKKMKHIVLMKELKDIHKHQFLNIIHQHHQLVKMIYQVRMVRLQ